MRTAFVNGSIIACHNQNGLWILPDRNHINFKLKKSTYGLKQSAHCWKDTLDAYVTSTGYGKSEADGCIYVKSTKHGEGSISALLFLLFSSIPLSNDVAKLNSDKNALC